MRQLTHVKIEKNENTMAACMLPEPTPPGGVGAELHCDHKYKKDTKYMNVQSAICQCK